jgi:prepilin-type processing-associated H-X9-DG protein
MAGEIILVPDTAYHDLRGRYYNAYQGNVLFSTLQPPNTPVGDQSQYCVDFRPWAPCQPVSRHNSVQFARSYHTGGVNTAFVDGSVHFLSNSIDPQVYLFMGSRAGGEIPGQY